MLYSRNVMKILKWSPNPHFPLSTFDALTEWRFRKWQRFISRMYKAKEAIKRMRRMALMDRK